VCVCVCVCVCARSGLALDVPAQLLGLVLQVRSAVGLQRCQRALQLLAALRGHAVPLLALCEHTHNTGRLYEHVGGSTRVHYETVTPKQPLKFN